MPGFVEYWSWTIGFFKGFASEHKPYCVWESQLKMASCRLQRKETYCIPSHILTKNEGRGWSCWRSPAETLSINGPTKPPLFFLFLSPLFFSPYVSIRKSISHPSAELNRAKKSNKKYPSRHRQEEGGGGGKDIESYSFFFKENEKNRELENVYNWNAFQHIFCRFLHHTLVLKSLKSRKKRSNFSGMTEFDKKKRTTTTTWLNKQLVWIELTRYQSRCIYCQSRCIYWPSNTE